MTMTEEKIEVVDNLPEPIRDIIEEVKTKCHQYTYAFPFISATYDAKYKTVSFTFKFRRIGFLVSALAPTGTELTFLGLSTNKPYGKSSQFELLYSYNEKEPEPIPQHITEDESNESYPEEPETT